MNNQSFKITLHMVSSLDGYVAKTDNSVAWFETSCKYENGEEQPDAEKFLETIDCYLMGSNTYKHALELSKDYGWAYGEKPVYVFTKRIMTSNLPNVHFYSGSPEDFIRVKLKPHYKNIWLAGGPILAQSFLESNLVDEMRISVLPIILGAGTLLFQPLVQEISLDLKEVKAFKNGSVEYYYALRKQI